MFQGESLDNAYPPNKQNAPRSALGYHTNNKYDNFPPLMSDGRALVGSWQPESAENERILKENGIKSNWQYRKYLTRNAVDIMNTNYSESANDVGYIKREFDTNTDVKNTTPYLYKSVLDNTKPLGYQTSDLKEMYLSREKLESRKVAPAVTQAELLASLSMSKN